MLDSVWQDVRGGWRLLRQAPLPSLVVLGTITVATGLLILTFALVYSILLRPLPFDRAQLLMALQPAASEFEALDLRSFQAQQASFVQVQGYYQRSVALRAGGTVPENLQAAFVTAGALDLLGVRPVLGRTFRDGEDFDANLSVTVIGEQLWRSRFGSDPAILDRELEVDGHQVKVVGIMPADFRFPVDEDLWFPMDFALPSADDPGRGRSFAVVGRLRDDVAIEAADAEARLLFARIWGARESDGTDQASPRVFPFAERYLSPGLAWLLVVTGAAAAGVLVVACANVANLTLARAMTRRIDVAVRMALGAGRSRIARHFVLESLVLAVPGTMAGVWLAAVGLRVFQQFLPGLALPYWADVRMDPPVLLLAAALIIAVAASASLLPALRVTSPSGRMRIITPARGSRHRSHRVMSWLVAGQVAGSCALLIAAGLLVRSSIETGRIDRGFTHAAVLTGRIALPAADYADPSETMARVLQRLESSPVIESASLARLAPGTGPAFAWSFAVDGEVYGPGKARPRANGLPAAHGYFDTMGIIVREGRDFTPGESRYGAAPVLIANRALATRHLGPNPLARRIQIGETGEGPWLPVVGVVDDTYLGSSSGGIGLTAEVVPQLYLSWGAAPYRAGTLVLRTVSERPETLLPAVRHALSEVIPTVALQDAEPLTVSIERSTWAIRLFGLAFSVFGAVTLLMSAVGLFGVMTFAVRERTHDIGIWIALGASPARVLQTLARQIALPVPLGLAVGTCVSVPITRSLRLLLFDAPPLDLAVYAAGLLSLVVAAALAVCGPAMRAMRTDPITALRID
jgi:putative ABC transport system permease protein